MAQIGAHLHPSDDTSPNATYTTKYRELKRITIADDKRASKFRVILTHGSGAREEFVTAHKAKKATVTCDTLALVCCTLCARSS